IVLDDEIAKGSTVLELLDRLRETGPGPHPGARTPRVVGAGGPGRSGVLDGGERRADNSSHDE
ncbi:hypothetical protein PFZ55_36235, partial [Streptomyces sp. MS2A]|nr:hypothetical protein [Streptomyces sp. MS2A]